MPIDTSMYQTAPVKPLNPIEMLANAVSIQHGINQNQLIQKTMGAQQAVGEAYQNAIGPDGQVDIPAMMSGIKGNPNAAFGAEDAAARAQVLQQAQLAQAHQQYGVLNGAISALLDKQGLTGKDVINSVGTLVSSGVINAKTAAAELASMPNDPQQLNGWLRNHLIRGQEAQGQIASMFGIPQAINTGAETRFVRTPTMGEMPQAIPNEMSPSEAGSPIQGFDGTTPIAITKKDFVQRGGIQTGPKLGQVTGADVTAHGSAQQGLALQQAADLQPQMKADLGTMQGDLKNFNPGPGSAWYANLLRAAQRLNINVGDARTASQDSFDKLANRIAQQQSAQFGGNTDQGRAMSISGNPNSHLSKMGNQNIIGMLKGNADAITAKNQLWQQYKANGNGSETYGEFSTRVNRFIDPRAFQMQYLTPEARKTVISGMSDTEKARFAKSYGLLIQKGLVPDPRGGR